MAKARLKQAVIKILTKLQAYHIQEKIKRNKYCIINIGDFVKGYSNNKNYQNSTLKMSETMTGAGFVISGMQVQQMHSSLDSEDNFHEEETESDQMSDSERSESA